MYTVTLMIENDRHTSNYKTLEEALILKAFAIKQGLIYTISYLSINGGGYTI